MAPSVSVGNVRERPSSNKRRGRENSIADAEECVVREQTAEMYPTTRKLRGGTVHDRSIGSRTWYSER